MPLPDCLYTRSAVTYWEESEEVSSHLRVLVFSASEGQICGGGRMDMSFGRFFCLYNCGGTYRLMLGTIPVQYSFSSKKMNSLE